MLYVSGTQHFEWAVSIRVWVEYLMAISDNYAEYLIYQYQLARISICGQYNFIVLNNLNRLLCFNA